MGKMEIPYVEKDGVLYPLLTVPADIELSAVGKYGLLWLSYMKEITKEDFVHLQDLAVSTGRHIRSMRKLMKCWM